MPVRYCKGRSLGSGTGIKHRRCEGNNNKARSRNPGCRMFWKCRAYGAHAATQVPIHTCVHSCATEGAGILCARSCKTVLHIAEIATTTQQSRMQLQSTCKGDVATFKLFLCTPPRSACFSVPAPSCRVCDYLRCFAFSASLSSLLAALMPLTGP